MKHIFRNIIAVIALVVVVYIVTNYAGVIQEQIGVKGVSTSRAQEIAGKIGSDVGSQVSAVGNQAMQLRLSDIVKEVSRFQRIPRDVAAIQAYVQEQYNGMVKSKEKKKEILDKPE